MGSNTQSFMGPERFMLQGRFAPPKTFTPQDRFTPIARSSSPSNATGCTASVPAISPYSDTYYNDEGIELSPASEAETARQTYGKTIADLKRIAGLGADWDSYGSAPPTNVAVETADRLIETVYRDSLLSARNPSLPYSVAPLSGGGFQLEWRGENEAIEVQVSPEGAFGYLLVKGAEPSCAYEEGDGAPESRILELVRSVQR
jgi:hypothetical protein